ncbi:hypothetical protein F5Y06DRAFT_291443 [Hypoxylon sp. FL0890]|nr:hypothetical protein F5Y06DRAFT_291443 [Hypoxylon sp. FL0890]
MPTSDVDLSSKVKKDPFAKLPLGIISNICRLVYDENIPELARASWAVHSLTRDNSSFWREGLKHNLAWFFEVEQLIRLGALRRPEKFKAIYLWAIKKIWIRNGLTGPLMHVANRRRIWLVCEQLTDCYWAGKY